ncbi:hypothetical protein BDW72DRAFT_172724 [Aspergillus terricola var. indicus]
MSQQNGVFPSLASIEAAPPTHGSGTTSIASSPSHSRPPTSYSSSTTANNSIHSRSGTISTRVHIPKLSAATTELLARFAGNIKGTQQKGLRRDGQTTVSLSLSPLCSNQNIQSTTSRRAGKMRVSSTIIELPTFPFIYPTRVETPVVTPSPACVPLPSSKGVNGTTSKPDGLVNIAPKPTVPRPASSAVPQVPVQTQLPLNQPPASSDVCEIPPRPHNLANIAPKPAALHPTSIPVSVGPHEQAHTRLPSEHQSPWWGRINGDFANRVSINIAPKPAVLYPRPTIPPADPSVQTQLPSDQPPSDSIHGPLAEPKGSVNIAPESVITNMDPLSIAVSRATAGVQRPPERQLSPPPPLPRAPTILKVPNLFLLRSSTTGPVKSTSTVRQRRDSANRKSGSKKRKRGNDSDSEDIIRAVDSSSDESGVTPSATQTTSGRQVKRPSLYVPPPLTPNLPREGSNLAGTSDRPQTTSRSRKPVPRKLKSTNIRCCLCDRGHSPTSNTIVFCDRCNRAWHQHCHDPPIKNEVVAIREKGWLCRECKPVNITILHPTVVRSDPSLTSNPPARPPLTIPRTEVGGERFSTDCRRRFLSTLSHAALVELLLNISNKNPTVPMFPENMESLPSSNFAASQAIVTGVATPTSLPANENNITSVVVADNIGEPTPEFASGRTSRRDYRESSDEESEYEFQDHRVYPRAGNGLRLSTNEQDLDILREDPTCSTFSYTLHAPASGAVGHVSA